MAISKGRVEEGLSTHFLFDVVSSIRGGDLPIVHISIRLSAMRHSSSMGLFRSIFFWFSLCAFCHSKASGSSFSAIVCASRISICHDQEPVPGHPCACFLQRLRLFPTTSAFIRPIDALLRAAAFQTNCKLSIACQQPASRRETMAASSMKQEEARRSRAKEPGHDGKLRRARPLCRNAYSSMSHRMRKWE